MSVKTIQDLLPYVQKPSRYLGTETHRILKNWDGVKIRIALAFPDLYDIGTSHFGLQILYQRLNQDENILAERVFAPGNDMEELLRQHHLPLPSLESRRPLGDFDIVGFSLLYELNYTNVLNMLDLAAIPLKWRRRSAAHPLVIAGGPCVCNPEPMAEFFDAMVFGDGEEVVGEMVRIWMEWRESGGTDREDLLHRWSFLNGVYVPRFFKATYDKAGFQRLEHPAGESVPIRRNIVTDLDNSVFPDRPIIPFGKPIHDRLRLEIARGCSRGCRFCQAGMIYRPVRERSAGRIMALIEKALENTGYEDLSLLSLSTGDYSCLAPLMECLIQLCRRDRVAVSLPSLRAGSLTPRLMELIRSIRKTGFTIAPEAGSQRLRDTINKNIRYDDVASTVQNAFELGWNVIKLYFMIGLPTETDEDLDAIVEMVQKLKLIKGPTRRKGKINVSVTTFVPKPHTPFQWAAQIPIDESRRKIKYLKERLDMKGVQVKWQKPEMSLLEGVLARGDRRVGGLIEQAWKNGCTFDGWNDQFDFTLWKKAVNETGLSTDFFTTRRRGLDEPLPWHHMDAKVADAFLKEQWHAAHRGETAPDCRNGECHNCGVCDFDKLKPELHEAFQAKQFTTQQEEEGPDAFIWRSLDYTKLGDARFFGHLEMTNIFSRAIRRARIRVAYSKGFHPMPKISFDDPLPLGIESEAEQMRLLVLGRHGCRDIQERLNRHLPAGVRITGCRLRSEAKKDKLRLLQRFSINLTTAQFSRQRLQAFTRSPAWPHERTNHKGRLHQFDLKKAISSIDLQGDNALTYDLAPDADHTIRPADVIEGIFKLPPKVLHAARVVRHKSVNVKSTVDNKGTNR